MSERTWGAKDEAARELERRVGLRAERDASLAEHTTMRVGGPADLLITVRKARGGHSGFSDAGATS